jgi:hypothetical protein
MTPLTHALITICVVAVVSFYAGIRIGSERTARQMVDEVNSLSELYEDVVVQLRKCR